MKKNKRKENYFSTDPFTRPSPFSHASTASIAGLATAAVTVLALGTAARATGSWDGARDFITLAGSTVFSGIAITTALTRNPIFEEKFDYSLWFGLKVPATQFAITTMAASAAALLGWNVLA